MTSPDLNPGITRAFLWSGVAVIVALLFAQVYLMGFIPPPSPVYGSDKPVQWSAGILLSAAV